MRVGLHDVPAVEHEGSLSLGHAPDAVDDHRCSEDGESACRHPRSEPEPQVGSGPAEQGIQASAHLRSCALGLILAGLAAEDLLQIGPRTIFQSSEDPAIFIKSGRVRRLFMTLSSAILIIARSCGCPERLSL